MNIFVLNDNPILAAINLCDKHIPKMIVESAQMVSTAHRVLDGTMYIAYTKNKRKIKRWSLESDTDFNTPRLYKAAMVNHPCTVWTRDSSDNYMWLCVHALQMISEFKLRFSNTHKSEAILLWCMNNKPKNILDGKLTPFAQAMPDYCKIEKDPVLAYRNYYINEKSNIAYWNKIPNRKPTWFNSK